MRMERDLTKIKPGTLVRVVSVTGCRVSLAYTSRAPRQLEDGSWVVKIEARSGWIPLHRIKEAL